MRALALRSSGTARPGPNTFSRRWHLMAAPAADAAGRCWASRAEPALLRQEPGLDQAPQQSREACFGRTLRPRCPPGCVGTRPRWRTWRPAAVRRCAAAAPRVGAVIGGNGSGDVVSATRIDGHSSGVPWLCQGRAGSGAGTSIPVARNRSCETGLSWGMLLIARSQQFPRPSAGCSWPALPAGFGISRVLGSAAPQSARRKSAPRRCEPARRNRVARQAENSSA